MDTRYDLGRRVECPPACFSRMSTPKKYLSLLLVVILLILPLASCQTTTERPREPAFASKVSDDFQEGVISEGRWTLTRQNDFRTSLIDVIDVGQNDLRLRLLADTVGTMDDTVKFHGVRTMKKIDFTERKIISFDLDWNEQANGSYLTAGIYLCPVVTDTNPRDEVDWIAFEYVGVPPGDNARFQIASKTNNSLRFLFTEGWPNKQRTGREIANQHVKLMIDKDTLKVLENNDELFITPDHGLGFTEAYLYLQMSSHSNYSSREVYFDNIVVK